MKPNKHKLITIADIRRQIYAATPCHGQIAVEIRPNGAVWIYAAIGESTVNGGCVPMLPRPGAERALAAIRDAIGKAHEIFPSISVSRAVDGVEVDALRHPRIEIHPSVVGGVL